MVVQNHRWGVDSARKMWLWAVSFRVFFVLVRWLLEIFLGNGFFKYVWFSKMASGNFRRGGIKLLQIFENIMCWGGIRTMIRWGC